MRVSRALSIVCAAASASFLPSATSFAEPVYKVVVDDIITGVTARHVIRSLEQAAEQDAELVLVQLATPGGLYQATRQIIESMLTSESPVVAYVAPSGAHAASAGFLILIAADVAAMAPGTNSGAATPVSGTGQEMDDTLAKKIQSDAAAYTRTIAERRGRKPELAELAVTEAKAWTAQEALEEGLIDIMASSESELLEKLHGRTVERMDGREITLDTRGATVVMMEMSTKDRILSVVANPNVAVLLGLIGLAGLYLEFSNPGMLIPGIVGALSLLLAAFAFEILPVNAVGILLLLVGFGLLVAEAFTPSFGALGAGGIAGILLGALMLFEEQPLPTPALRVSWQVILPVVALLAGMMMFMGRKVYQAQRHRPTTGSEGLVGKLAVAMTPLEPRGKVFLHGEYWNARAREPVREGEQVKVVAVDGLLLEVEKLNPEP